jgi:hypothetical protein
MLLKKIFSFDVIEVWFMAFFAVSITATAMGCGRSTSKSLIGGTYVGQATTTPNTDYGTLLIGWNATASDLNEHFMIFLCEGSAQCMSSEDTIEIKCAGQGIDYGCVVNQSINGITSQFNLDTKLDASSDGIQVGVDRKYFFVNVYGLGLQLPANKHFDVYRVKQ